MDAGHGMTAIPHWQDFAIVLVASALVAPVFQRFKASPVFGFLAAGAIMGPYGLAATDNVEGVQALAELGVVFLLFTIGLELSFERLKAMRRLIFGLGTAQVMVSAAVIGGIAYAWGNSTAAAVVIGLSLALSSTAIVVQLLIERGEMAQRHGRTSFAILLFQDLAVVPILMLVSVLSAPDTGALPLNLALAVGKAIGAVIVIILVGRLVLRRLYRLVASVNSREALLAMSLLVVLATALVTAQAGLSMALGAFLAGLVLAETEYRHQVESDIEPFKGLLLGLFFVSIGMNLNFAQVADWAVWLAASVVGIIVVKATITVVLCRFFALPWETALRSGLILATGGEFAFVILGVAMTPGSVLPTEVGQFMVIVATLSMVLAPGLAMAGARIGRFLAARAEAGVPLPAEAEIAEVEGHVVIAGYGRVGQMAGRLMDREKIPYLALDLDARRIARFRREGLPVFYGDASRADVLAKLRPQSAIAILITLDDSEAAARAVRAARFVAPGVPVVARASDDVHADELRAVGADSVVPETLEASLQLAATVLRLTGAGRDAVDALVDRIRDESYASVVAIPSDERSKTSKNST